MKEESVFIFWDETIKDMNNNLLSLINEAIGNNTRILLPDLPGLGIKIQKYLYNIRYDKVTVYTTDKYPKNFVGTVYWGRFCQCEGFEIKYQQACEDCSYAYYILDRNLTEENYAKKHLKLLKDMRKTCFI